jgi:predicted O-methyltransferase YrrM
MSILNYYIKNKYNIMKFIGRIGLIFGTVLIILGGYLRFSNPLGILICIVGFVVFILGLSIIFFQNLRQHIDQIEKQLSSIQSAIGLSRVPVNYPVFLSRYSAAPDFVELIYEVIRRRPIERILEIGSGSTSIYISAFLRYRGRGKLICLEENISWANLVQSEINLFLLERVEEVIVKVIHSPLEYYPSLDTRYYNLDSANLDEEGPFDLLIIDGPGDLKLRWPAFSLIRKHLSPSATIILDDGDTDFIRSIVQTWKNQDQSLQTRYYPTIKGTWILFYKEEDSDELPFP